MLIKHDVTFIRCDCCDAYFSIMGGLTLHLDKADWYDEKDSASRLSVYGKAILDGWLFLCDGEVFCPNCREDYSG